MLFKTREGEGRLPCDFGQQHPVAGVAGPRPSDQAIASARPPRAATRSLIDRRLLVTGDLEGRGELQVEGKVEGNIRCALLVVGSEGIITGDVTADEVVVRGEIKGTIRANSVVLQERARVNSEIFYKLLSIEAGVCFEGVARRSSDPTHVGGWAGTRVEANPSNARVADPPEIVQQRSRAQQQGIERQIRPGGDGQLATDVATPIRY